MLALMLSLGNTTLVNASPPEVVTAAAAGGFDAVGIRITGHKPGEGTAPVAGNPALVREILSRRDEAGIAITHVSTYWVTPELTLADFRPVIETAAALGARMIGVNCGDPDEARFVAFMAAYCEAAARYGLKLALEFMPYSGAKDIEQAERMVERAAQPNFGLTIDALHLARSNGTPAHVRRVPPHAILLAQLCDAPARKPEGVELRTEALGSRLYPGHGELPLHDLLDALPPGVQLDVETPAPEHAGLTPGEQAIRAGRAAREFLDGHSRQRRAGGRS